MVHFDPIFLTHQKGKPIVKPTLINIYPHLFNWLGKLSINVNMMAHLSLARTQENEPLQFLRMEDDTLELS